MQLHRATIPSLLFPLLHRTLAQSSSSGCGLSCDDYETNLYRNYGLYGTYGSDVTGNGPIDAAIAQVSCPQNVFDCYKCGGTGLTSSSWDSNPLTTLHSWFVVCTTLDQLSVASAVSCWNSDLATDCADTGSGSGGGSGGSGDGSSSASAGGSMRMEVDGLLPGVILVAAAGVLLYL